MGSKTKKSKLVKRETAATVRRFIEALADLVDCQEVPLQARELFEDAAREWANQTDAFSLYHPDLMRASMRHAFGLNKGE